MKNYIQGLGSTASDLLRRAMIRAISFGDTMGQILLSVGSILKLSLDRSLTNARTEIYNSFRDGYIEQLQESADENDIIGWIWRAEKDVKTCIVCLSLDGTKHSLEETMKSHCNCRCQMEFYQNGENIGDNGLTWFHNRSNEDKKYILGNGKYEAWKRGEISLDDLVSIDDSGYYYEKSLKDIIGRENTT